MDKGILNQSLLEKDIEKIKFYSQEEKVKLNKLCNKFNEISKEYKSNNTVLLLNNVGNLKNNINQIYEKRIKYTEVLNRVISQYNRLSDETLKYFEGQL